MRLMLPLLLLCGSTLANGVLTTDFPDTVRQVSHRVDARVRDRIAEVTVEQVFHNGTAFQVQGMYTFPLPDGAGVTDFAMSMGGKMVKGEVLERGKARGIYESVVHRRRDPGLLERMERGIFRARVFPIEPKSDLTIRLVYQQVLPEHEGTIELRYPLAKERVKADDVGVVIVDVDVESSADLVQIHCASHRAEMKRDGARKAKITWSGERDPQRRDFLLYLKRDPAAVGFSLLSHKEAAEPGYFLAAISPAAAPDAEPTARDVVYVLDTSGSMREGKLEQAKRALQHGLSTLRPNDRFNVVAFSSGARPFRDGLVGAGKEPVAAAREWIGGLAAEGGTALDEALRAGLGMFLAKDRLGVLVLLTDGLPTIGVRDPQAIVRGVEQANRAGARVFVFGVGFDQNVKFLDRIATMTRGSREYVSPEQDIDAAVRRLFTRLGKPALTDLRLEFGPGVHDVYPRPLPDLFAGDRLVVMGRYDEPGPRLIRLHGRLQGKDVTYDYEGVLGKRPRFEGLKRLWAQRKVDFLEEQPPSEEVRDEIVRLGTRHGIVTRHTAGLVVEEDLEGGVVDAPSAPGGSSNSALGLGGGAGGAGAAPARRSRVARRNLKAGGGSSATESAVELALAWLSDHQGADGGWDDVEQTGLALIGFLGAGYTDRGSTRENRYAGTVRRGLGRLMQRQAETGSLSADSIREHAVGTLALCEAYWMTRNPRYKRPGQKALDFLASRRDKKLAWGRSPLTTAWAVMALRAGRYAGLEIDPDAFEGARRILEACSTERADELAAAMVTRVFLGESPRSSKGLREMASRLADLKPGSADGWYFGSLAMFQVGGRHWKEWNRSMKEMLLRAQSPKGSGDATGSWGGGVSRTAKLLMCLEVYYRYQRWR